MKKLYVFILSISLIAPAVAQPTFDASDFVQIGQSVTTFPLNTGGLSEGSGGANQTWNFSTAVVSGAGVTATAVAPSSTPYGSMYPNATIAMQTISSGGNDAYGFYNVTSGFIDLIGAGTHSPSLDVFFTYSDAMRVATFPFTYNTSVQDNFVAFATYIANGLTINDYRRGNTSVVADGYGSVTTPDAYYASALRIVQSDETIDSIVITGFPTASMVTVNRTSYSWLPDNLFTSVFSLSYDTTDQGSGPVPGMSASYSSAITSVNENYAPRALEIYPNPASKSTRVNFSSDELISGATTFRAMDLNGRVVKEINFVLYPANHKSVSIDMSDCTAGLYFIQLVQEGKMFSSKFMLN